jgi:hypothetical protein
MLHVIRDIYNLFHKSSKMKGYYVYDVQPILEKPLLKMLEAFEVHWLGNFQ